MHLAHLHPLGGYAPDGGIEVYLGPFRLSQFTWAKVDVRDQLERNSRFHFAAITIDCTQQFPNLCRFQYGRMMLHLWRNKGAAQDVGRVVLCAQGRHRVAKNATCEGANA